MIRLHSSFTPNSTNFSCVRKTRSPNQIGFRNACVPKVPLQKFQFPIPLIRGFSEEVKFKQDEPSTSNTNSSQNQDPRVEVLDRALNHVQLHGWTIEALSVASMEMGFPGITHGIFTDGPVELVYHFVYKTNQEMITQLSAMDLPKMSMKERLLVIIKMRLQLLEPFISRWAQALSLMGTPEQLPKSIPGLASLVDEMLYQAGDQSTDFDWYAKRALVSAIYVSSELYMLSDASQGRVDTWKYLERRIDDLISLTNIKTEFGKTSSVLSNGVISLLTHSFGPK